MYLKRRIKVQLLNFLMCASILITSFPGSVLAFPGIFGPEWEFTNDKIANYVFDGDEDGSQSSSVINTPENEGKALEWAKKMRIRCKKLLPTCSVVKRKNKYSSDEEVVYEYQVVYKKILPTSDGNKKDWSFTINIDPGTIEVQATPLTVKEYHSLSKLIQKDVFDMAKSIGIAPDGVNGAGHIHLDLHSNFENNPLLFRNFLVDFYNHTPVWMGALNFDDYNATVVARLSERQRENLEKVLAKFDSNPNYTIYDLAKSITKKVYYKNPYNWEPGYKYQALNLSRTVNVDLNEDQKTIEIRALRSQRSAEEYINLLTLFESRIQYLKTINHPIKFINKEAHFDDLYVLENNSKSYKKVIVDSFYKYVTESGLSWEKYAAFLPAWCNDVKIDQNLEAKMTRLTSTPIYSQLQRIIESTYSKPLVEVTSQHGSAFYSLSDYNFDDPNDRDAEVIEWEKMSNAKVCNDKFIASKDKSVVKNNSSYSASSSTSSSSISTSSISTSSISTSNQDGSSGKYNLRAKAAPVSYHY